LAGEPSSIAQGPVPLAPLQPIAPAAANGQPLSKEIMAILENAVRDAAAAGSLDAALEIGYRAFGASARTAAAREGITAFQEGRKPDFSKTA
jgi:enoyl-CoA hydratase/3-hydroxyacyl-CoA dehydrogenase